MADDWYRAGAGHYWRGLQEQIMRRSLAMARRIGENRAGWYCRRLKPSGQVVKGPYKTLRAAKRAANRK
jgi:hypothetical protein